MLHKCANQSCNNRFLRLTTGKLFRVEMDSVDPSVAGRTLSRRGRASRRVEHYWLCDDCAASLTLTYESDHGVVAVPLVGEGAKVAGGDPPLQAEVVHWDFENRRRMAQKVRP